MEEKTAGRSNAEWLDATYDKLLVKMKAECARIGTQIPYTTGGEKPGRNHPRGLLDQRVLAGDAVADV